MASSDTTALMLQMIEQIQGQPHVAQEMMQEQQRAADERQRQFMVAMLERRADQTLPLPDLRSRSSLRSRSTSRSAPGNPKTGSKVVNYRRMNVPMRSRKLRATKRSKPRRFRSRQRRPTQSATSLGFIGHFMQGSRVRYRGCGRVSQRGMSQARAALTGQWTQGAPTSRH